MPNGEPAGVTPLTRVRHTEPMYVNANYSERELPILHDMIETARFGLLVLCADGPHAAHIPFVLHRDQGRYGTLVAHVARNDPLARHLAAGKEALAIFTGPRAYVSPRWSGGLPTYNYLAVHASGRPRVLSDPDAVLAHLTELVAVHEQAFPDPWTLAATEPGEVDSKVGGLTAFTLEIDAIQGKRKLSQNRTAEKREHVIRGLRERGGDDDRAIAATMSDYPYA
jgi:transcriptional regulator